METAILFQSLGDILETFLRNIRIVDILDITIISFFIYVVLNWLRQSASRRILISFFIILSLYFVARFSGMYLTERLIEVLFVIIFIGVVVVFQSDMRRVVDRISNWNLFGKSKSESPDIATSIITEAATSMAKQRIGALIAIRGREDWSRHIHGGINLNGDVTIPLLHSIFNTKAPGHDGAVLCEGSRVLKFGAHLPLSTNLYKLSAGGTRHTAALGLSELCDALLVVVSEERGTISIAKDGQIRQLESGSDLKKHLDEFWKEHYRSDSSTIKHWWKRRSLRTAFVSVILSFILWLALAYPSETVYRTYALPIEYRNLESTRYALQDSVPLKARVTLSGSEQAFRSLDPSQLVISFDLSSDSIENNQLKIDAGDINLPADLSFVESMPPALQLSARHFISRELPVRVSVKGSLPEGLQLVSVLPKPDHISVLIDTTTAATMDSISTAAVNLETIKKSKQIKKQINVQSNSLRLPDEKSAEVNVSIKVRESNS